MRFFKNIFHDLYIYLLWAVIAWVMVGFVFTRITDTSVDKKLTILVNAECREKELAAKLEETKPDGIKMIKVHNFDYYMFNESNIQTIDFFIIPESEIGRYTGGAMSIEKLVEKYPELDIYIYEGIPVGIKVHSAGEAGGVAAEYIEYGEENYYLLFNGGSTHSTLLNDSADDKAIELLEIFLKIK